MCFVLCETSVDIDSQLKRLDQELKFFAIVLELHTELFVEYEVWGRIDSRDECNDLLNETCTLLDWPSFQTIDGGERARDKAVVQGLCDASEASL